MPDFPSKARKQFFGVLVFTCNFLSLLHWIRAFLCIHWVKRVLVLVGPVVVAVDTCTSTLRQSYSCHREESNTFLEYATPNNCIAIILLKEVTLL